MKIRIIQNQSGDLLKTFEKLNVSNIKIGQDFHLNNHIYKVVSISENFEYDEIRIVVE